MSTAEKMTPTEAQKLVDLMNAPEPEDFTSKTFAFLENRGRCQYEVAMYGDERLICGEPAIQGTARCQQHQGLDIREWEHIADHDCLEGV